MHIDWQVEDRGEHSVTLPGGLTHRTTGADGYRGQAGWGSGRPFPKRIRATQRWRGGRCFLRACEFMTAVAILLVLGQFQKTFLALGTFTLWKSDLLR